MSDRTYFTMAQRERVAWVLTNEAFDERIEVATWLLRKTAQAALCSAVRQQGFNPGAIEALPSGVAPTVDSCSFNLDGFKTFSVVLPAPQAVPYVMYNQYVRTKHLTPTLVDDLIANQQALESVKDEKAAAQRQALALLSTFRYVEKAVESWPEAAAAIRSVCGKAACATLPAARDLNAVLGLPWDGE